MTLPVLKPNSPGADSVDVSQLPDGLAWYAGYVGGSWPTWSLVVKRFGSKAHVKSVAINAGENADILDVELGDASVGDAPSWFGRQVRLGARRPGFYTSASNREALVAVMLKAGVKRSEYVLWIADWDGVAAVSAGDDAKQYNNHGARGQNCDPDVCNPSFFDTTPDPVHHNTPDYKAFDAGPFPSQWGPLSERSIVVHYDLLRKRPVRNFIALRNQRAKLAFLADRVAHMALYTYNNKKRRSPDWKNYRRGYRFQQLIHRSQGQRFV